MKGNTNNNVHQTFSFDDLKNQYISFSESERYWIQCAIDSSSNGGDFEDFRLEVSGCFQSYRSNELPQIISKIGDLKTEIENVNNEIESLLKEREQIVKAARKAKNTHHAKEYASLKSKRKEIDRELKQVRAKRINLQLYLADMRKKDYSPVVRISKFAFYGISGIYVLAASILNVPIFQEVIDGIPAGGILAPVMAIIEGYMAHLIGMSFGIKNKKVGYIVSGVSMLILSFIIAGQILYTTHSLLSSAFITLLFILGCLTSYIFFTSYFDREVDNLIKKEHEYLSELDHKQDEIDILKQNIETIPDKEFDSNLVKLKSTIKEKENSILKLQAQHNNRLEQINALEAKIISQARTIFNSMNTI